MLDEENEVNNSAARAKEDEDAAGVRERWISRDSVDGNVYLQDEVKKMEKKGYISLYQE